MTERYQEIISREAARKKTAFESDEKLEDMFERCYCNTIDTTVKELPDGSLFVITGDIEAMWLRDSSAQVHHYLPLASEYDEIYELISRVLEKQVFYILLDPYANAFNVSANGRHYADDRSGQTDWTWERKYEVDSLCFPVDLAYELWKATDRADHFGRDFEEALERILDLWETEQYHEERSAYRFERDTEKKTETLERGGLGSPTGYTGMTWSGFRCSDDACTYGYLIPSNMYACVVLGKMARILEEVYRNSPLAARARKLEGEIRSGIETFGIVDHPRFGKVYAYETDGLGNGLLMDDAGIPSLLSIPYIGYCSENDPVYVNTRKMILSSANPYYYEGTVLQGIGSAHTRPGHVWPMALIIQAMTSRDPEEIRGIVRMLKESDGGTGYIHESIHKDDPKVFTRPWFAWVNSLFSEMLLSIPGDVPM